MTDIKVSLPDALAREAQAAGLLSPESIEKLIADALRKRAFDQFLSIAERFEALGIPPMTPEEIDAEIKAYRRDAPGP